MNTKPSDEPRTGGDPGFGSALNDGQFPVGWGSGTRRRPGFSNLRKGCLWFSFCGDTGA